ncbi:uncharacterized protein N7459_007552 [Penicillium hispanicum]|uniref:uncharacterized protein n=1 Tax=Penicillium hispanicum TaxID=1080232 RepID=UPI0025407622|nr:uncharacterized protein N7459_007552 [Penicillium hispanicum]KAJ5578588.1 hypothetical protein N7459_007552 [Penicillium hispanicum]
MPLFERATPPPLWSSFPSSRLSNHRRRESAQAITSDITMGNTQSRTRKRDSLLFSLCRPSSRKSTWDPPSYDSLEFHAPQRTKTASPDPESQFEDLRRFDTVFLVDDSSSMSGPRWREAEEAIAAIAPICTQYDHDGIDIYFLNHRSAPTTRDRNQKGAYTNVRTAERVKEIFHSVRPRGSTPVGQRLLDILDPYRRCLERVQAARRMDGSLPDGVREVKPINVISITDGLFTDDAESVIIHIARKLDSPRCDAAPGQVGIQFFQIGEDDEVREYLEKLDNHLGEECEQHHLRDIVDTVPWRGKRGEALDAEGILKCVLGAVNKRLDRVQLA